MGIADHVPLPWVNAVLFVAQAALTGAALFLGNADAVRAQHDTLVTPAAFAFSIWNVIYLLTMILLVTDISYSGLSLYDAAVKPDALRLCFAASCLANGAWCLAFATGNMTTACVLVTLLWLTLLPLYVFASHERRIRPMVWSAYLCSELCVRLYFAWITVEALVSWTIALQGVVGGFLSLSSYLALLEVVVVLALCGLVYGRDPVMASVMVWALVGLTSKDATALTGDALGVFVKLQAAATLGAGVLVAMAAVSSVQWLVELYHTLSIPAKKIRRLSGMSGTSRRSETSNRGEYGSILVVSPP